MKSPAVFAKVKQQFERRAQARKELAGAANEAQALAKRAIFALHRDDAAGAAVLLEEAAGKLESCAKRIRAFPDLDAEGSVRAAREEYAEARLFEGYVRTGAFGALEKRLMEPDVYLAALSDATGEAVRFALRRATEGRTEDVDRAFAAVDGAVAFLYSLDLTGYLRTKFDQAKKNLRSLEQMRYELAVRTRAN